MAALDLKNEYQKVKNKIQSTQAFKDLKQQYDDISKGVPTDDEDKKSKNQQKIDAITNKVKKFEKDTKTQFDELLKVFKLLGGSNTGDSSKGIGFLKKTLLRILKNIEGRLGEIVYDETIKAIGCDQQQTYQSGEVPISMRGLDLLNLLLIDYNSLIGKTLYERDPVSYPQTTPFSMNRELFNRTQNPGVPFSVSASGGYKGSSGQVLFDFRYEEQWNGLTGPFIIVDLKDRLDGSNSVSQLLTDYYKTIKLVDFNTIVALIMESLTGAISISANFGVGEVNDKTKFNLLIQRILGLCFDNATEIDVSGVAKVSELDVIDESFFEFSDVELRQIEQRTDDIKNGVIEFQDCDNIKLPLNPESILIALETINFVSDNNEVEAADQITTTVAENPAWRGIGLTGNFKLELDENFIKKIVEGLVASLLSPKLLLPFYAILTALGQPISSTIKSYNDFAKKFKSFTVGLVSKIGAIFVQELYTIIKKDILQLIQAVVSTIANEKKRKIITIILKLIQILIAIFQLVGDWRKCKSVVDELLTLLNLGGSIAGDIASIFTSRVPLPLLYASEFLGGYSESRAFIGTIEEFQKLGIPTGALSDGSPNTTVLSFFSLMKAMEEEKNQNGKVQIASGPYTVTPSGLTIPKDDFGIYL
jgi:hypothetical protein